MPQRKVQCSCGKWHDFRAAKCRACTQQDRWGSQSAPGYLFSRTAEQLERVQAHVERVAREMAAMGGETPEEDA